MEGIEKITARIIEDAEREIAAMQQETEEEVNTLLAQAQTEAEQESMELLVRGRRAAEERRERLSSSADMECRKLELAAKQELLMRRWRNFVRFRRSGISPYCPLWRWKPPPAAGSV